jgi:hypothetical protein
VLPGRYLFVFMVVNDAEARIVVDIYRRYLALKSVPALREELAGPLT